MAFMQSIGECLNFISDEVNRKDGRIRYLIEENKKLKDKAYRDTELQRLQNRIAEMEEASRYGFKISKNEFDAINEWTKEHNASAHNNRSFGACGGRYTYCFTPTGIGMHGVVRCSCGAEFEFQEIE